MTFQSLDTSPVVSVEVPPGAAILRRGAATAGLALRRYGLLAGFLALRWTKPAD